jgi:hypothetical protein
MTPRTASFIALSLIAIACGIVLFREDDPAPSSAQPFSREARASKAPTDGNGRHSSESRMEREAREERERLALIERDKLIAFWSKQATSVLGHAGKDLVTDLELDAAQGEQLDKIFSQREELLADLLTKMNAGESGSDAETFRRICALIRNKGLREDLAGVLSPQQLATFDENETMRARETIEARAYRDMAAIHSVLQLSATQKQEVLVALMKNALEKVENEADTRAFMTLTYGLRANEMDSSYFRGVTNLVNGGLLTNAAAPSVEIDSAEFLDRIEEQKALRIETELATLRGVLDEKQLARYREHLENEPAW